MNEVAAHKRNRQIWRVLIVVAAAVLACGIPSGLQEPTPTLFVIPTFPPEQTPTPQLETVPQGNDTAGAELPETVALTPADLMLEQLTATEVQAFDLFDWLVGTGQLESGVSRLSNRSGSESVGTRDTFYVITDFGITTVNATLSYQNDVVQMWVPDGFQVDLGELQAAADTFASQNYEVLRSVFGEEWKPGIDNNPRFAVLNMPYLGLNIGGYFTYADQYPQEVIEFSNEREMFYMSLLASDVGTQEYMATLTHEFQHMVQWNIDRNEAIWANEGLSQVAERVVGYDTPFTHYNYLANSQTQLNTWAPEDDILGVYSHYGAAYLYLYYIRERFGDGVIAQIARHPANGLDAVDAVLASNGTTADQVFSDWIVANYVNDLAVGDGRYGYSGEDLIPVCPRIRLAETRTLPPQIEMPQYTPHYIELEGEGEFSLNFQGQTEVGIIPAAPHSGSGFWWANNEDQSTTRLTRAFDLSGVEAATLQFWTWYDLEEFYDVGYVMASADGGQTWEFLAADGMYQEEGTYLYAPNYTNVSGGGEGLWVRESIDLTDYVGKEVLLRFEYITDINHVGNGWAIDDIAIPELGYSYDAEQSDDGWIAEGFLRVTAPIPQRWSLALVTESEPASVTQIPVDPQGRAAVDVTLPPNGRATLIVGAMAAKTLLPARFALQISGPGQLASYDNPSGIIFQEDFEDACSTFDSFVLPDYSFGYREGRYIIEIEPENDLYGGLAQQNFGDLIIQVDTENVQPAADSSLSLLCRFDEEKGYYSFDVRNDGTFRISGTFVETGYEALVDWTASDAIQTGPGAQNRLSASCVGDVLSLSVNGEVLGSVNDVRISRGDIGFFAETFDAGNIIVAFDNLIVTAP